MHQGRELKKQLKVKEVNISKLAEKWDMERTSIYSYFGTAKLHDDTIKRFEDEFGREFILPIVREPKKETIIRDIVLNNDVCNILHIPQPAEAGFLGGSFNPIYEEELIPWFLPSFRGKGYSWNVSGRSMEATLEDGYTLITSRFKVDRYQDIENDFIYVIITDSEILIKRVNKHADGKSLWLNSDNEDYPEIEMPFNEIRAIYKGRRFIGYNLSQKLRYE